MNTTTVKEPKTKTNTGNKELGAFIGELYSFNNSLKLYHWHVSGKGSYAQHIALDQALAVLPDCLDRLTETTYALKGDLNVVIPQTSIPGDIVKHASGFYDYVESKRELFSEDFSESIIDDIQEAIQQLLYRLIRLQ
ncbi:DUF5856 family protein [Proteiniphilum sp. UBA5384]|uniref:DUF5856 family protein n=1 Tax=Proteiniphilum sp. UBA5384 TaxID=1947279 RepID=UPI0025F9B111|nr:DUF5856 family protein [Proteiniphilum sp. UBA5384]